MEEISLPTIVNEYELLATKDELKFIFSQAELQLKESLSSGDSVLTRSTVLLSILLGIVTSIVGYTANLFNSTPVINNIIASIAIITFFTAYIIYKLIYNIRGSDYKATGSQPKDLFHNWYFENYKDSSVREKIFILGEIKSYQERITINNKLNRIRWNCFHFSLRLTALIPFVFIVCYLIFSIVLRS